MEKMTTTTRAVVGANLRLIYLREYPTATYIQCGFCTSYRAIDPSFMVLHIFKRQKNELIRASIVNHNAIPQWNRLDSRAIFIT
jgi:hypothetical protein